MSAIPFISTEDLCRTFSKFWALHRVNLTFDAGEVSFLLGPNGAGKSTLLSILATLDAPSSGRVDYGGKLGFDRMKRKGRGLIGWVSHEALVYSELTALENLRYFAKLYCIKSREKRLAELIDRVGLTDAADRPVRTFSRGMKQRLSLARGMLNEPSIWLMDEPFSGLDFAGRARVIEVIREARDQGNLIIIATHAMDLAVESTDKVVIMKQGRVRYSDKPGTGTLGTTYAEVLGG